MISNIYGRFLNWFLNTKFWSSIGDFCATFNLRFFGYVTFPIDDYFKIIDKVEPNNYYIFLSTDSKTISSILIKTSVLLVKRLSQYGLFSHAGLIFFDGDRNTKIMHVNHAGFQYQSFLSHLKEVDYLAVIKLPIKEGSELRIKERIEAIKGQAKQIEYDWEESLDNDAYHIYCSELLYLIFKDLVDNPNFTPRKVAGKYYFDPDLLLKAGEVIYCNHPKLLN